MKSAAARIAAWRCWRSASPTPVIPCSASTAAASATARAKTAVTTAAPPTSPPRSPPSASAAPQLTRIVAFGNCDAASALLLHQPLALDGLILANPWTYENDDSDETDEPALPPAAAIRARYLSRLTDPKSLLRLLKGEIDVKKLARGLSALGRRTAPAAPDSLPARLNAALATLPCPATILLATGDRTAQAFVENCDPGAVPVERLDSASHSFAGDDGEWLAERVLGVLRATMMSRRQSAAFAWSADMNSLRLRDGVAQLIRQELAKLGERTEPSRENASQLRL